MKEVFDANPEATVLLVFEDGTCFLPSNLGEAKMYSRDTKQTFSEVKRPEIKEEEKPTKSKK